MKADDVQVIRTNGVQLKRPFQNIEVILPPGMSDEDVEKLVEELTQELSNEQGDEDRDQR